MNAFTCTLQQLLFPFLLFHFAYYNYIVCTPISAKVVGGGGEGRCLTGCQSLEGAARKEECDFFQGVSN